MRLLLVQLQLGDDKRVANSQPLQRRESGGQKRVGSSHSLRGRSHLAQPRRAGLEQKFGLEKEPVERNNPFTILLQLIAPQVLLVRVVARDLDGFEGAESVFIDEFFLSVCQRFDDANKLANMTELSEPSVDVVHRLEVVDFVEEELQGARKGSSSPQESVLSV